MQREHLIERRRSAGTRVVYRPQPSRMTADISGVLANLADMGRNTKVQLLSFDYVQASGPAAEALGAGDHELLQRSVRVRSVDGLPFSYLLAHVPERIGVTFSAKDLADRPLLELLERSGVKVERATQRISAGLAAPDVARALGVKTGSPLIELVRTVYDRDGRGVEHLHALYRPDRYSFEFDLVRSGGASKRSWSALPLAASQIDRESRNRPPTFHSSKPEGGTPCRTTIIDLAAANFCKHRRSRPPRPRAVRSPRRRSCARKAGP